MNANKKVNLTKLAIIIKTWTYVTFALLCLDANVSVTQWRAQSQIHGLCPKATSTTWSQLRMSSDSVLNSLLSMYRYFNLSLKASKCRRWIDLMWLCPRFKLVSWFKSSKAESLMVSMAQLSSPKVFKFFSEEKALSSSDSSEFASNSSSLRVGICVTAVGISLKPHFLIWNWFQIMIHWKYFRRQLKTTIVGKFHLF